MSVDEITLIEVGIPGPPGSGVTASQLSDILNRLTNVEAKIGIAVQDEDSPKGQAGTINFVGAGVTAAVTAGVGTVTIPGAGGTNIVVQEGDVTKVALATVLDFADGDFNTEEAPTGEANISANRAFDSAKPQFAQVYPNAADGNSETASTTNTSTWVPAKTLSWTLPAGHYTIGLFGAAILVSDDGSQGGKLRTRINANADGGITSTMGLDNTTLPIARALTGVVSDGSIPTVIALEFLSTSASVGVNCFIPAFLPIAQRTL